MERYLLLLLVLYINYNFSLSQALHELAGPEACRHLDVVVHKESSPQIDDNLTQNVSNAGNSHSKAIFCYVHQRQAKGDFRFDMSNIEPSLCTHLVISYVGINEKTYKINNISDLAEYYNLKKQNKDLKILIGVGGWMDGSIKYSNMAANPNYRKTFVKSIMEDLNTDFFDGVDLAWDTPTQRGGIPADRRNYVALLMELSKVLKPKGYLLTVSLRTQYDDLTSIFDLANINYYVDFVKILSFDYNTAFGGVVDANTPLRARGPTDTRNVESTVRYFINNGVSPNKLILGLAMRGHTFIIDDTNAGDVVFGKTKSQKIGFPGPLLRQTDLIGYNEICAELLNKSWVLFWDEDSSTPYLRDGKRVISFDNPRSIANKVKLAMDYDLAGVSAYTLPNEDYRGVCPEDTDTYKDYEMRYNMISWQRVYKEALADLFIGDIISNFYVMSYGETDLCLPTTKFPNYPLLRTINEAIPLALEEKRVIREMERQKEKRDLMTKILRLL